MNTNTLKLTALLTALTVLFVLIGQAIGGTTGMVIAVLFAILMNGGAYWFSDRLVLSMSGAREAAPDEYPWLHQMVADLAARANLPLPKLYIMDTPVPNAFATGRSPDKGVVAVTTGIMNTLERDELAGVVAHELAHIKNRDTLLSAIVASIAGAVTMIANMGQWALIFGGFGGSDEEEGGSMAGGLLMLFIAPIAATLIQLGISRAREYQADARGADILGDPRPLARALEKIELYARGGREPLATHPAAASLYIINPLAGAGGMMRLFSTHPPTEERVARLEALAQRTPTPRVLAY